MNLHQELEVVKVPKSDLSAEIAKQTMKFLKEGGVIQVLANNAKYDRNDAVSRDEWGVMG